METLGRTDGALIAQSPVEIDQEVYEVVEGLIAFYPGVCGPFRGATAPLYQITFPVHKTYAFFPDNVKFTLNATLEGLVLTTPMDSPTVCRLVGDDEFGAVLRPIVNNTFAWPPGQPQVHHTVTNNVALTYESLGPGRENTRLKFTTHHQAHLVRFLKRFLSINLREAIEENRARHPRAIARIDARNAALAD